MNRSWFPEQVNISKDKIVYPTLSPEEKRAYDLVLAQLITNDSIQTNQLMDKMNSYITSPVVNACLSRQAMEEAEHSDSYSIIAEDICQDTDRIFDLHNQDEELARKNKAVENMYTYLYNGDDPEPKDILLCFVANQILEELVFPGGFVTFFSLGDKVPGTVEMLSEIAKDETLSHVPLFKNIFRTAIKETFGGVIPDETIKAAHSMIIEMADAEKRWTKYVTKGMLGFSDRSIDIFVEGKANSVCTNLGMPLLYPIEKNNPLQSLLNTYIRGGDMETKQNFFETNVTEYSKGGFVNDL